MRNRLAYCMMFLGLFSFISLKAQTASTTADSIQKKITVPLTEYFKRYPQEKAFIHTDRTRYLTNQTIWYKVYTMAYGKPSQLSKIAYVRLSAANGAIVKQDKRPLENGTGFGDINIPDSLATGWYTLRAFTAWMLNFEQGGIFSQRIFIKNIHDRPIANDLTGNNKPKYHIAFFPEGGNLIDGSICNIAFKAICENGQPAKVSGDILDGNDVQVAKLSTIHDGMGSFELEALANTRYTARVHFPDNSIQNVFLPPIEKAGIDLRVNTSSADELIAKISCTRQKEEFKDILMVAVQNNGLSVSYSLRLSRGTNIFSFNKNAFAAGILRLTIFDDTGVPLAERVVFINNNASLSASINIDTSSHRTGEKNLLTIHVTDIKAHSQKANLSIAITAANEDAEPNENIFSYFLMTSELRGYIHDPAYYFKNNSDTLQQHLDLVMLTNGWRRFKWNELVNAKPKAFAYAVEKSQFIAGKIENYDPKDNLKLKIMMTDADSGRVWAFVRPDSAGVFKLDNYNNEGATKIYYEGVNSKNIKLPVKVTFFNRDLDTLNFTLNTLKGVDALNSSAHHLTLDTISLETKQRLSRNAIALKTVTIQGHKLSPVDLLIKDYVQHFNTDNAQTLDLVNVPVLPSGNLIDFITGKFPGLEISPQSSGDVLFEYHGAGDLTLAGPKIAIRPNGTPKPFFYINETLADIAEVKNISLTDVALIQFVPPPVWFAPLNGGFNGAILIYIKTHEDDKSPYKPKSYNHSGQFDQYIFDGYSITREFAADSFSNPNDKSAQLSTFYWAHDADTDDNGNVNVSFYNSARPGKCRIIVQGMDNEGKLVYLNQLF